MSELIMNGNRPDSLILQGSRRRRRGRRRRRRRNSKHV
jgi:hypothetical protein